MLVPDINVLVRALILDAERHRDAQDWLESASAGTQEVGIPSVVLSGLVRVLTDRSIFTNAVTTPVALAHCRELRAMGRYRELHSDRGHWDIFERLLLEARVAGPAVSDAYLAAFAIQHDATFVTFDRGFARFPGLRWMKPDPNEASGTP